jgi:hypothetical protein
MRLSDLLKLLQQYREDVSGTDDENPEIRIGDQLEAGPYEHYPLGGIWQGEKGEIILVAHPDADGLEESPHKELPKLWASDL